MSTVWLVGKFDGEAAADVRSALSSMLPAVKFETFERPSQIARSRPVMPDLVLVYQRRPGEIPANEAERLLSAYPLSRFVVAFGPWCASHARSEEVWPPAVTVPLASAVSWLRGEAKRLSGEAPPAPLTSAVEELFAAETSGFPTLRHGDIAIDTPDRELRALLAELFQIARDGSRSESLAGATLLWDADPITEARLQRLIELRSEAPVHRVIALTGSPSDVESVALRQAGADLVLPKPFLARELFAALTDGT